MRKIEAWIYACRGVAWTWTHPSAVRRAREQATPGSVFRDKLTNRMFRVAESSDHGVWLVPPQFETSCDCAFCKLRFRVFGQGVTWPVFAYSFTVVESAGDQVEEALKAGAR